MAKRNFVGAKGARLLRRVAKHILAEPRRYEQNIWKIRNNPGLVISIGGLEKEREIPACGTVACIGGWITALTSKSGRARGSHNAVCRKIGISPDAGNALFGYDFDWPEPFRSQYKDAAKPREKARIAAARIEHFIKTGE